MAPRRRRRPQQRPKTPPIPQPAPGQPLRRSPRLVVAACPDDHLRTRLCRTASDPQLQQQAQQPRKRKKQQGQQTRPPLPAASSSSEDDDTATSATPRRKRKEIANVQVQPAKRLRTRAETPPPRRSSPRSRKNVLLVVAPCRNSPEPPPTSAFSLLAQRAPLDMIDLGPTLLSDCSKDETTLSWTSPPSPLTPLSTAPPSPTSPTSAPTDEKGLPKPLDDSMDVDDAAPPSRSPDKPAECAHSPQETQGPGQRHDDTPQGSLSPSSSSTTPLQSLQPQATQQQHPFQQQLPVQSQPLQPLLQHQYQSQQQAPPPHYTWYELQQQESQQQILHWEEPPRLDLIKNVWKFACKYRVWDVYVLPFSRDHS